MKREKGLTTYARIEYHAFTNRHTCGRDCYWRLCSEVEQNLSPVHITYIQCTLSYMYIHGTTCKIDEYTCELPLYGPYMTVN